MDALVIVRGPTGQRSIQFTEFHRLPGSAPERDNVLERGDLILAIEVPTRAEGRGSYYLKVCDRQSYEFALVSVAVAVAADDRRIRSARTPLPPSCWQHRRCARRRSSCRSPAAMRPSPVAGPDDVIVAGSNLSLARTNLIITYDGLLARNGLSSLVGTGDYDPVEEVNGPKAIFSFSAVFAEVRVDLDLGLVRLSRFVGAYDAGRIINPKTARSQAIGGIIWGVGQALLEQSETDPALGRFINRNYSGYLVPTNADVPELDVSFVGEFDEEASPLGAKGLGELTAVSVAPAIANAVYHASGRRIRDLPITVENLL